MPDFTFVSICSSSLWLSINNWHSYLGVVCTAREKVQAVLISVLMNCGVSKPKLKKNLTFTKLSKKLCGFSKNQHSSYFVLKFYHNLQPNLFWLLITKIFCKLNKNIKVPWEFWPYSFLPKKAWNCSANFSMKSGLHGDSNSQLFPTSVTLQPCEQMPNMPLL